MRKAFTLIELLVVIAIIAILAAILFPVFAQAKESAKITAALSQTKQMGTGFAIYEADADDNFPLAMMKRPESPTSLWGAGLLVPSPSNASSSGVWANANRRAAAETAWGNSIQPYIKSWELYNIQGQTPVTAAGEVFTPGVTPAKTTLTMNGLMHGLSATSIASPSVAVLLWPGAGGSSLQGRHFANPALNCSTADDCKFNAGGKPSSAAEQYAGYGGGVMFGVGGSIWVFNRHRSPFVRTDTSAKVLTVGTAINPNSIAFGPGIFNDPYAMVDANGKNAYFWSCSLDGNGDPTWNPDTNYPCYFRPDRTK